MEASDVDGLVEFTSNAIFFDLARLALFLEETVYRHVDVVRKDSLRSEIRDAVRECAGMRDYRIHPLATQPGRTFTYAC